MFIRVDENDRPWLMNRPDRGWDEFGKLVEWEELLTIRGPLISDIKTNSVTEL